MRLPTQQHGRGRLENGPLCNGASPAAVISDPHARTDYRQGSVGGDGPRPAIPYRVPGPLPIATHRLPVYTFALSGVDEQQATLNPRPPTYSFSTTWQAAITTADKVEKTSLAFQHLSSNLTLFIPLFCRPRFAGFLEISMNCPSPTETYPRRLYYTSSRPEVSGWPNIPPNLPTSPLS